MASEGATVGALRFVLGADSATLEAALEKAKGALAAAARAGVMAGTIIANAMTEAATALAHAVGAMVRHAAELQRLSQQLNVPVEVLSRLQFAAEQTGATFDQLKDGLTTLKAKIEEAIEEPFDDAGRAIRAMGISLHDATGALRPVNEVLAQVADRFASYQDGANKSALATALLGSHAQALTPMLNLGSRGLAEMGAEADRVGATMSGSTATAMRMLSDIGTRLQGAFTGIVTMLTNALGPSILALITHFQNSELSAAALKLVVDGLAAGFRVVTGAIILTSGALRDLGDLAAAVGTAMKQAFSFEGGAAVETMRAAFANFGTAFTEAMNAVTALNSGIGAWQTTVQRMDQTVAPGIEALHNMESVLRRVNSLIREQMQASLSDPMLGFAEKMREVQYAYDSGAISMARFQKHVRELNAEWSGHMQALGTQAAQTITAIWPKQKGAAIAAALINTMVGVTKALASAPPPFNFIQAALVAAAGMAQVRAISSTSMSGGGSVPSVGGGSGAAVGQEAAQAAPSQALTISLPAGRYSHEEVAVIIEGINERVQNGATLISTEVR